jgi:hypothetical protein
MEDSVTLNDTVILRARVNSLMYTPNPLGGLVFLMLTKFLALMQVKV